MKDGERSRTCSPSGPPTRRWPSSTSTSAICASTAAIAIDVGDQDGLRADAGKLHDVLEGYGIANGFEIYPGTHTSAVAVRFQNFVMPFFSKNLDFEQPKR